MNAGPPNDTHPKIEALLIEGYRKMSPSQKLERVRALTRAVQELGNPLYDQRSHAPLKPAGCHGWRAAPRMGGDARDRARCSARAGASA